MGDELGSQRSAGQSDIGRQLQEPASVKIAVYRRGARLGCRRRRGCWRPHRLLDCLEDGPHGSVSGRARDAENEAIEECRRSINMNNLYWFPYVDLVSAFGTMGLLEQARQPLAELKKLRSDFTVRSHRELGYAISSNPQFRREYDDLLDGLKKAGVPEQ